MESSTFRAGTIPGSPDSYGEIKMMILYCLRESGEKAVSFNALNEAFSEQGLVNYFALTETIDQLVASGHISNDSGDENGLYGITPLGENAASEFKTSIPFSIREKAVSSLKSVIKRHKRLSEISVSETPSQGGYILELSIPDQGGDIMKIQVFAPGKTEANLIKRRFLNNPIYIYKSIMTLLTGDESIIGGTKPEKDELF